MALGEALILTAVRKPAAAGSPSHPLTAVSKPAAAGIPSYPLTAVSQPAAAGIATILLRKDCLRAKG